MAQCRLMLFQTHGTCVLSQVDFPPAINTKGNNMATKTRPASSSSKPRGVVPKKPESKSTKENSTRAHSDAKKSGAKLDSARTIGKKEPDVSTAARVDTNPQAAADTQVIKKLSAIDAAAQVLTSSGPLNCKELIKAMAEAGLWSSPGGKTPHATLYSAILREIKTKGDKSRFVKTERGRFAIK